jgi:hypothetical protein
VAGEISQGIGANGGRSRAPENNTWQEEKERIISHHRLLENSFYSLLYIAFL